MIEVIGCLRDVSVVVETWWAGLSRFPYLCTVSISGWVLYSPV